MRAYRRVLGTLTILAVLRVALKEEEVRKRVGGREVVEEGSMHASIKIGAAVG